jgi:hypothetical protein
VAIDNSDGKFVKVRQCGAPEGAAKEIYRKIKDRI